ncbi:la-related protein 1C [Phalaenopsis equestris]|uniref:la-related protein 1C n=1 Tax=Phalaenopsis equestris TaxID=78828 RepID=UPI0009E4A7F6|nr:la-related protein 1C [Phalaenopsis equestris]
MASAVDPTSSPRSARPARNLSASWSHVAAAAAPSASLADPISLRDSSERSVQKLPLDSPSPPPPPESPDHVIDGNAVAAARGKKTVWNVPSNGSTEGGAVMDALCWPALSESARASPKSSSSDSLKGLPDGSVSVHPGPVSPTSKPASSTPIPSLTSSPSSSSRHKTMKHVATNAVSDASSNSGGMPNGGLATPSPAPTLSQISQPMPDRQPSPKGLTNKNNNNNNNGLDNSSRTAGTSHQTHGGNDQHRGYGGGRRGNNGQYNSYGNRRDPERGGYEWNHRNFVRDVPMQQLHPQWGVRSYSRPPPVAAQLIAPPPPPRPFSHNMGFHDMSPAVYYVPAPPHPDSLRGLPFAPVPAPVPAPPVMFIPAPDPQRAMLLKQIDYYFSPENLCKDTYLRSYMDEQGWVHISLIADFNRVKLLTKNVQYILDTLRSSSVVEVQGEKIRRRNDWSTWVINKGNESGSSGSHSPTPATNYDALSTQFHNVGLEENSSNTPV